MGFTRDFTPRIGSLDDAGRVLYALGYCGEGVVMSQVFGRLVARLATGERDALDELPFAGLPPWLGPEPLRSLGTRLTERALRALAGEP